MDRNQQEYNQQVQQQQTQQQYQQQAQQGQQYQQQGQQQYQQQYQQNGMAYTSYQQQPKKDNTLKIVIGIIAAGIVAFLLVCGIFAVVIINKVSDKKPSEDIAVDEYLIKGTDDDTEEDKEYYNFDVDEDNAEDEEDTEVETNTDDEFLEKLNTLGIGTDYDKVKWGVQYTPEGMEGLLISVTPVLDGSTDYRLLIAMTNLYDTDIDIDATGYVYGEDDSNVADIGIYESCVGSGATIIEEVYCDSVTDGRIHWSSIVAEESDCECVKSEADWNIYSDIGIIYIDYNLIYDGNCDEVGAVHALILDKDGYVIDYNYDYKVGNGKSGTIPFYSCDTNSDISDAAIFMNPLRY